MHFLYPEGEANLRRAAGRPAHEFFKSYGERMPAEDWNDPGTKQGVYMIGPDAEYLEGGHAISGNAEDVRRRLRTALDRSFHKLEIQLRRAKERRVDHGRGQRPEVQEASDDDEYVS